MNARPMVRTILVTLLSAVLLWAGDPWKEKPWTEWTEKEVEKLLHKSPWARPGKLWGPRQTAPSPSQTITKYTLISEYTVRWESSLTVRQAQMRRQQLEGSVTPDQAEEILSTKPEYYLIVIEGELGCRGSLEPRRSKQKVSPAKVHNEFLPLRVSEYYFPRTVDGQPVIGPDEKKVSFRCKMGSVTIKKDFDLAKMVRNGKPDL